MFFNYVTALFYDISWRQNIEDCHHDHEMIIFWKERETCCKGFGQNGSSQKRSCLGKRCLSSNGSYAWVDAACKYYLCESGGRQFIYQEKWNKSLQFVENYFVNDAYIFVFCERSVTSLNAFSTCYVTSDFNLAQTWAVSDQESILFLFVAYIKFVYQNLLK